MKRHAKSALKNGNGEMEFYYFIAFMSSGASTAGFWRSFVTRGDLSAPRCQLGILDLFDVGALW